MFKLTLKLLTLALLLTAGFLCVSGGKVAAAPLAENCSNTPGANWGNHDGPGAGKMSSLVVHAVDASQGNAPLNTRYILNSEDPNHPGNPDLQARIFDWPIGNGRTDHHAFNTGETLHGASAGDYHCNGWSVLGTGSDNQHVGNGWVIDCGALGQESTIYFSISHVDNPDGAPGRWRLIDNGVVRSEDVNNDGHPYKFNATNGGTQYLTLQWVPKPPGPDPSQGQCNFLDVYNRATYTNAGGDHKTRAHVTVSGVTGVSVNGGGADWGQHGIDGYAPDNNGDFGSKDKVWRYTAESPNIHVTITEQFLGNDGNWYNIPGNPGGADWSRNCISVSCSVTAVGDYIGRPGGIILAGDPVYVSGRITNTSPPDGPKISWPYLSGTGGNSTGAGVLSPGGDYGDVSLNTNAPGSVQDWYLNYTVAGAPASASCQGGPVPIYQYFNIQPRATLSGGNNAENPTTVSYTGGGSLQTGPTMNGIYTHTTLTKNGGQVKADDGYPNYGSVDLPYTYNNPSINAGDTFCSHVTIDPASGYHGPHNNLFTSSASDDSDSCLITVNEPYVHFAGSDVSAGGGFGDNCTTNTNGSIYSFLNTNGARPAGSGSQFGAQALGVIQGLSSANLRSTAPTGHTGLTFSNSVNISGSAPGSPNTGGRFGLSSNCVPDYFSKKPDTVTNADKLATTATAGTDGAQYYTPNGGKLTLHGGTIGAGVNEAIYVENGDVYIDGPITYGGSRTAVSDIQSFYLVVKNGNIYIDPSVTQLDGVYVAQPSGSNKGKLTTCSNGFAFYAANKIYDNCKRQLVVNGAFVAQKIFLDRAHSSLRYSQSGEYPLGAAAHACGNLGGDILGAASKVDCAGEVFNFSPELFLAQPAGKPVTGPGTGRYDYITSLSPVL